MIIELSIKISKSVDFLDTRGLERHFGIMQFIDIIISTIHVAIET